MTAWKIERVEETEGSNITTVSWRAYGQTNPSVDGDGSPGTFTPTAYGQVSIEGLTITPSTTESELVEKVKHALNATQEQRDEHGNIVPPLPDAKSRTDEIEAGLAKQAEELAHPKNHAVELPWKARK